MVVLLFAFLVFAFLFFVLSLSHDIYSPDYTSYLAEETRDLKEGQAIDGWPVGLLSIK